MKKYNCDIQEISQLKRTQFRNEKRFSKKLKKDFKIKKLLNQSERYITIWRKLNVRRKRRRSWSQFLNKILIVIRNKDINQLLQSKNLQRFDWGVLIQKKKSHIVMLLKMIHDQLEDNHKSVQKNNLIWKIVSSSRIWDKK